MADNDTRKRVSISQDQFVQLITLPSHTWTTSSWTDVRQGPEDAAVKALMRAWYEKSYEYKWKGNKEQAMIIATLDEVVAENEQNFE